MSIEYLDYDESQPGNPELYRDSLTKQFTEDLSLDPKKDAFHHLYKDLVSKVDLGVDFEKKLNKKRFNIANHKALGCLNITMRATEIPKGSLVNWTSSAVHAFNVTIENYITVILNEIVPPYKELKIGTERSLYRFLSESHNNDAKDVGRYFEMIYSMERNQNEHIIIRDKNGIISYRETESENKRKQTVLKWFKGGLHPLLRLYQAN